MSDQKHEDVRSAAASDARGFAHTPGPWAWELCYDPQPGYIEACLQAEWGGIVYHGATWPVHQPDASLIVAAPDLLAACKALLTYHEWATSAHSDWRNEPPEPTTVARDAIAKAEGAPPVRRDRTPQ